MYGAVIKFCELFFCNTLEKAKVNQGDVNRTLDLKVVFLIYFGCFSLNVQFFIEHVSLNEI